MLQVSRCVLTLLTAFSFLRGSSARRLATPPDQHDEEDHAEGHHGYTQQRSLDHYDAETLADMFNGDKFAAINWWTGKTMVPINLKSGDQKQDGDQEDIRIKLFETGSWWTPVEPPVAQNKPPRPPPPPTNPAPPVAPPVSRPVAQRAPVTPPTAPVPQPTAPVSPPSAPTRPSWWSNPAPPTEDSPVAPPVSAFVAASDPPPPDNNFPGSSTLTFAGNDGSPASAFPLGRCEADCDENSDCFGGMVCYKRDSSLTSVPGCFGDLGNEDDYCIDPQDNPSNIHKDTFRLKLFWQEGYLWQEEERERRWCMDCSEDECDDGENLKVRECGGSNTKFQLINEADNAAQIYIPKDDKCLEASADEKNLKVEDCDDSESAQRFWAGPDGSFNGDRFELIPKSISSLDECMTQRHHPKDGEVIYREKCETARNDRTSFWSRF